MSDTKAELQLANALLTEHVVNQQAEIDRLKSQRDRLVARFKGKEWKGHVTDSLIAEIEAE